MKVRKWKVRYEGCARIHSNWNMIMIKSDFISPKPLNLVTDSIGKQAIHLAFKQCFSIVFLQSISKPTFSLTRYVYLRYDRFICCLLKNVSLDFEHPWIMNSDCFLNLWLSVGVWDKWVHCQLVFEINEYCYVSFIFVGFT